MTDLPVYMYNRDFNAPLDRVWRTWTEPDLLAVWYGPGVETTIHQYDLRPGGVWLNEMRWGDTSDYSRMDFVEVEDKARIVWNHASTDRDWNVISNPMMPNWPRTLLTTVTFRAEGDTCRVRLEQVPVEASEAEIACFAEMMGNMDSGWGKGFDLFETLLDDAPAGS